MGTRTAKRAGRATWPLLALTGVAIAAPASAQIEQEPGDALQDDLFQAEEVVVTGTRREASRELAAVAPVVVGREEIDASGAQNAAELLEDVRGVRVRSTPGGQSVQVQGIGARRVLVLVDGQRIAGRVDGVLDLSRFPVENIERIEVVRGAASALYGSDAIGGVINIITRKARRPWEAQLSGQYGFSRGLTRDNFWSQRSDNYDLSGQLARRWDELAATLSLGYRRAAPFDLTPSDPATSGSGLGELSAQGRATWTASRRVEVDSRMTYLLRDQSGVDTSGAGAVYDRDTRSEQLNVSLKPRVELGKRGWLLLRAAQSTWRHQYRRDQRGDDDGDRYEDSRELLSDWGAQLHLPQSSTSQLLTLGVDGLHQRLRSDRLGARGTRTRISPFLQTEWTPSDRPYLVLVPGVRVDLDTQYGVSVSPKLSARYDPHPNVALRASAGRGFRAPSFKELLLRFENPTANYRVEGNPRLSPETAYSANVGLEWRAADTLTVSLDAYRNELRDLIAATALRTEGGTTVFGYVNLASAYTQGAEIELGYRPRTGLNVALAYALTDARDRTRDRPLADRALHSASLRARYAPDGSRPTVSLRAALVGRRPRYLDQDGDGQEERQWLRPYASVDARVAQRLSSHLTLFAGVDNLLGAGSSDLPLRPMTLYAGLRGER